MRNRMPTEPGRVKLTRSDGSTEYVHMERADEPQDEGTPLNKETLLTDQTEAALFGNSSDRTVDDAFAGIAARLKMIANDMASITLTVTDMDGNPMPGVYVANVFDENGQAAKTDSSGKIDGFVPEGNIELSIKSYADIADWAETVTFAKGQSYTKSVQVTARNFLKLIQSQVVKFSENVLTYDYSVVGAGAGGAAGDATGTSGSSGEPYAYSGPGGTGGEVKTVYGVTPTHHVSYPAKIGAGGKGGIAYQHGTPDTLNGTSGGDSSFSGTTAKGGQATTDGVSSGIGGGRGGNSAIDDRYSDGTPGNPGQNGTDGFESFTETKKFGAGGGSGGAAYVAGYGLGGNGGDFGGGNGGESEHGGTMHNYGYDADPNTGSGGGGGGVDVDNSDDGHTATGGDGGDGADGVVAIRMHLKSAA